MIRKMGRVRTLIDLIPGLRAHLPADLPGDEDLVRLEAIILAMTPEERRDPDLIDGERKQRIAAGAGATVQQVSDLVEQLYEMRRPRR